MMLVIPPRRRRIRWGPWHALLGAGLVLATVVTAVAVARVDSSSDFRDFWRTAREFARTGQIRDDLGVHNYLPFFVIFMTPWSAAPPAWAVALFTLLSMGLMAVVVLMCERVLVGRIWRMPSRATRVALLLMLPFIYSTGTLGAVNILLLFLIVGGLQLALARRDWEAGAALGLAVLIKLLPAALLCLFVFQRRWRVVGGAALVGVVLGLGLPLASLGWADTIAAHRGFVDRAVVQHSAYATIYSDQPTKARYTNQSLPIVLRRLLTRTNADAGPDGRELHVNVVDAPRGAVWACYLALLASLLATSAYATLLLPAAHESPPAARRATANARSGFWRFLAEPETTRADVFGAQFAVWCCVMLLASPLAWTHYFVLAYWPLVYLGRRLETLAEEGRTCRWSALALLAWLACLPLIAWPAARAVGAHWFATLLTWMALVRVIRARGGEGAERM